MKPTPLLPTTYDEMKKRGWDSLDVLLITGDAYFDSPTHGVAVIGRVLEHTGYKVGIIARPNWKNDEDFTVMGRPNLFVGISAGAVDSTLNNYTASLAPRKNDAYAPVGDTSKRPNYATAVYSFAVKKVFPKIPIVLGGIEASTRRFAYYDYLKKSIRRSVLLDTRADILVFGSGEFQAVEIAKRLKNNQSLEGIKGTAQLVKTVPNKDAIEIPSYETVSNNAAMLISQTQILEQGLGPHKEQAFFQSYQEGCVYCEPPYIQSSKELDEIFKLPFSRKKHPSYKAEIPASKTVEWSIITQRGCPGGCSFCAIAYHQGRQIISRSKKSVLKEINTLGQRDDFKGTITDIGGPTANAYGLSQINKTVCESCKRSSCFFPTICKNIDSTQTQFVDLLNDILKIDSLKHVFIASGIRHDLALKNKHFIKLLAKHFTGGHLKVAPEHSHKTVLNLMRKPSIEVLEEFEKIFITESKRSNKEQYIIPYFIAGFPGCTKANADHSASWLKRRHQHLEQVQTFIPLPGTMAAAMYASGKSPKGDALYIPDAKERKRQKNILLGKSKHQTEFSKNRNRPTNTKAIKRGKSRRHKWKT